MKTLFFLSFFLTMGYSAIINGEGNNSAEKNSIEVSISNITIANGEVSLDLCFKNISEQIFYIEKSNFPNQGVPARDLFAIRKNNNLESYVRYKGMIEERGKNLDEDDYIKINSGSSISVSVKLSDYYLLNEEESVYSIMYDSENRTLGNRNQVKVLKSNEINGVVVN